MAPEDSNRFLAQVNERGSDLRDVADRFHDLNHFYEHQRPMWDKLSAESGRFKLNQMELDRRRLRRACAAADERNPLAAPNPYGLLKEAEGLIRTASEVNERATF